ncbi:glycosyltransferase [Aquirufa sp. KTFRIE-69F]|uniref:Glycosyltransferase n=1 Tax=Aquirufa originis TaxID=3096514 RepID=A0ABW6D6Y7_9BACT
MSFKKLHIVLLSYHDSNGGAGIAAGRLKVALEKEGHQVDYIVREKGSTSNAKKFGNGLISWLKFIAERLFFLRFEKDKSIRFLFNPGVFGSDISRQPLIQQADIVHLHWVNFGFLSVSDIAQLTKLNKPVFWTLHDMWAFTGGCHHSGNCEHFQQSCGDCKFLKNPNPTDLSHRMWEAKKTGFAEKNLHIITCSDWLGNRARQSSILGGHSIKTIPNAIDTEFFSPTATNLGLNPNKKYVLFVAMRVNAPAKGFHLLKEALQYLDADTTELLIVGGELTEELPLKAHNLGQISDPAKMRDIYAAADAFVTPSLEENLPNTIMEAMACGTACVGFEVGGIPEMIEHEVTGYVAQAFDPKDLAKGIQWSLNNKKAGPKSRERALQLYDQTIVAQQHLAYYAQA